MRLKRKNMTDSNDTRHDTRPLIYFADKKTAAKALRITLTDLEQRILAGLIDTIKTQQCTVIPTTEINRVLVHGWSRPKPVIALPPNATILNAAEAQQLFQVPSFVVDAWFASGVIAYCVDSPTGPRPHLYRPQLTEQQHQDQQAAFASFERAKRQ
jgi:hypothetical protein